MIIKKAQKTIFLNHILIKKICSIIEVKNYSIYECDVNKFDIKDIKKFPTLYIVNNDINYIFNMTGEDLFYKLNNKYYFKIVFPLKNIENNRWIFGRIFLRKYPTTFSPSNRFIGFYINPNEGTIKDDEESEFIKNDSKNKIYIFSN